MLTSKGEILHTANLFFFKCSFLVSVHFDVSIAASLCHKIDVSLILTITETTEKIITIAIYYITIITI